MKSKAVYSLIFFECSVLMIEVGWHPTKDRPPSSLAAGKSVLGSGGSLSDVPRISNVIATASWQVKAKIDTRRKVYDSGQLSCCRTGRGLSVFIGSSSPLAWPKFSSRLIFRRAAFPDIITLQFSKSEFVISKRLEIKLPQLLFWQIPKCTEDFIDIRKVTFQFE